MRTYTMHMILFGLMLAASVSPVPGRTFTVAKLHQSATLPCERKCPGSVKWTMIQKPSRDVVVARCDRTSCSSEEGFIISRDQYREGNLSLTVTAADYSRRGWYTCHCDGENVCIVSLRFEPVEMMKRFRPGDSLVVDVQIPERVEVTVLRSGGDGARRSDPVRVCTADGRRVECEPEYQKRVVFKCSLTLTALKETESDVYTLRDTDNDEIISTHTLALAGNDTDDNNTVPVKGTEDSWNIKRIFVSEYRGVLVGFLLGLGLGVSGVLWGMKICCFIWRKVKRCWREDPDHSAPRVKFNPVQNVALRMSGDD